MGIDAYLLAGDATWLLRSAAAYYARVRTLLVTHDVEHRGWDGLPVASRASIDLLRGADVENKMVVAADHFARMADDPDTSEAQQRQHAVDRLRALGADSSDWVLQLDACEVLPDVSALLAVLATADRLGCASVEWPMRVLYRQLAPDRFLQIAEADGGDYFDYPGPIAVRAGSRFTHGRQTDGATLRAVVPSDRRRRQPAAATVVLDADLAVWQNAWARPAAEIWRRVRYSPSTGAGYFARTWLPAPRTWRRLRDVHPVVGPRWPALVPTSPGT